MRTVFDLLPENEYAARHIEITLPKEFWGLVDHYATKRKNQDYDQPDKGPIEMLFSELLIHGLQKLNDEAEKIAEDID